MTLFDLTEKVALVTGSGQGLGLAMARGLGEAGATVVLNGRTEEKLTHAAKALQDNGLTVSYEVFDVSNSDAIDAGVERIIERHGHIDILVNNAGIQRRAPLHEFNDDDWQAIIDINLTGVYRMSKAVAPGMIERRAGKIINIGSVMSELGRKTIAPYTASKGGVKMLTRGMAIDWGPYNIQVNAIGPGYFATKMNTALLEDEAFDAWVKGRVPAGRWGDPAELVGTVVYLASNASNYVNGHIVYVDGGLTASV